MDEGGILRNGLPEYKNQQVFKANPLIVELLKSRGVLLGFEKIEHSYPHCWRCHNPIIFRATEQWFIAMEGKLPGGTLRSRALEEIQKVKWDPAWGEERISNMIATRPDWCISRQRIWGVPIAVFQCEACQEFLNDPAVNRAVVELFAREGADSWYRHSAEEILPPGTKCPKCGGTKFRKEMDIIDVWFESGSSQAAVLGREPGLPWPADLYLEGGDQHRGWFHSSLLCAVAAKGAAPYREVGHRWLDARPAGPRHVEVAGQHRRSGRDRRQAGRGDCSTMGRVGGLPRGRHGLRRADAAHLRKLSQDSQYVSLHPQQPAGFCSRRRMPSASAICIRWTSTFLLRAAEVTKDVREHYDNFVFHRLYHRLKDFCIVDLSAIYFDVLKDRLYTSAPKSLARRSAQTALWRLGEALVRLLAPVTSFTSEEVWGFLPTVDGRPESVHLALFPQPADLTGELPSGFDAAAVESDWDTLVKVRNEALKVLETSRAEKKIGGSLEAQLHVAASEQLYPVLERHRDQLRYLFIVSDVVLEKSLASNGDTGLAITVNRAPGQKCERCWNYSTHVGEDKTYPTVCERCSAVLAEIEETAKPSSLGG